MAIHCAGIRRSFCKVCDESFSIAHGPWWWELCQSWTHRGNEKSVKMNSSTRQFFAAPSKTADSKAVSVTRAEVMLCELIVEQNIPLLSC